MKNSKLQKLAWVFFALLLTSTTIFAQGWGNRNRVNFNQNGNCLNNISGITEKQQKQIQKMEDEHHTGMDELRNKRRLTTNAIEESEIRTEMLKKVEAHRNSVKKILTADQQKQYEQLHMYRNNGRNQQFANGACNRNLTARGNRHGNFSRGNRGRVCYANANSRGQGENFKNGNGRGNANRNYYQYGENNFRGQNANYGRGYGRFSSRDTCVLGRRNISDEGFKVIE